MATEFRYQNYSGEIPQGWSGWYSIPRSGLWTVTTPGFVQFSFRGTANENYAAVYQCSLVNGGQVVAIQVEGGVEVSTPLWNQVSGAAEYTITVEEFGFCNVDSDCGENQKCVDGVCVDCEPQQATHFQVRWEFEELHQDQDGNQVMFVISDLKNISNLVGNDIITSPPFVGGSKPWAYPRIRFCKSSGEAAPYSGSVSIAGYCNPDGSMAMFVKSWPASGVETPVSWLLGDYSEVDLISDNPLAVARLLIEWMDSSETILESACSGVGVSEPPDIPPVEPEPPEEPVEPDDPEETDPEVLIEEPVEPIEPENTCECEVYLAKKIAKAIIQLSNSVITLGNKIDARFEEQIKISKQTAEYLKDTFQPIFEKLQVDVSDIEKYQKDLSEDIEFLKESVADFVEQYEPVQIENEYRTQSHRIIDNLDSTIAGL